MYIIEPIYYCLYTIYNHIIIIYILYDPLFVWNSPWKSARWEFAKTPGEEAVLSVPGAASDGDPPSGTSWGHCFMEH